MTKHLLAVLSCAAVLALGAPTIVAAQNYPSRPIKLIVPFAPGGPTDIAGRLIAQKMSEELGQAVVVDNRVGAGGSVGMVAITGAAPDGYTIGYGSASTMAINPSIYPKLTYNIERDLIPIGLVAVGPYVIVVHPSMPQTLPEFIAYVKANPGKVNMGSSGIGSSPHLAGLLFNQRVALNTVHVPYGGGAPGLAAIMKNEVQYIFDAPTTSKALAEAGKIRILAVTGSKRSPVLPNVPTVGETGLKDFVATSWSGLVVPARTPTAIVARLNQALRGAMASKDLQQRFAEMGVVAESGTAEDFARFIKAETIMWSTAAKTSGIDFESQR